MRLSSTLEMDFSFQKDTMYRRMRRLICFDMDSTLIETEVIDELAKRAGVGEQVQEITERAMIHLFRQLPERTFRHRLCICQQSGNSRRQTHRTLCW